MEKYIHKKTRPKASDEKVFQQFSRKWPKDFSKQEKQEGLLTKQNFHHALKNYRNDLSRKISDFEKQLTDDELLIISPIMQQLNTIIHE